MISKLFLDLNGTCLISFSVMAVFSADMTPVNRVNERLLQIANEWKSPNVALRCE